jgi:hypothetical protein
MRRLFALACISLFSFHCKSQDMVAAANAFIATLNTDQKNKALFPFDSDERYNFHFFPKEDRKGIALNELSDRQKQAAVAFMKTGMSESGVQKAQNIIQLESVLKVLEKRGANDHYRDPGKYYFTIFGVPGKATVWGWRLEGHHLSFSFSAEKNKLVSGTPVLWFQPGYCARGPAAVPSAERRS